MCRHRLVEFGYEPDKIGHLVDDGVAVRTFFGVNRRLPPIKPRRVLKARKFDCPSAYAHGLAEITRKIRLGINLMPHLSKKILDPAYNDALLNHWGIHHLHPGTVTGPKEFITRPKGQRLLFCRFDDENAYLINILPHDGNWTAQELVRTIHENWPASIKQFRFHDSGEAALSDTDVGVLRKKNANHVTKMIDGTTYLPLGGGTTASGHSIEDVYMADRWLHWANRQQERIVSDLPNIKARAQAMGLVFPEPPTFQLTSIGDTFFAQEVSSGYSLALVEDI